MNNSLGKSLGGIEFKSADGHKTSLNDFVGKVALIVNVASKCGLTPQYKDLQTIFQKYRDRGFVILAFPANEFGNQEPGTNAEIQEFCESKFGVQFPVFEKIVVKGEATHPLYKFLTNAKPVAWKNANSGLEEQLAKHGMLTGKPQEIKWNFEKFLVNRKGEVVGRYAPDVAPEDPQLTKAIEIELAY